MFFTVILTGPQFKKEFTARVSRDQNLRRTCLVLRSEPNTSTASSTVAVVVAEDYQCIFACNLNHASKNVGPGLVPSRDNDGVR